ncbi:MAG: Na(+)/H(+) antiporter subunit F [Alphaproteobacteria bacterium ADurb.BinA305]|nr:MAG: Na(+)/H(+) antiporter subunit F [Alphaproteobacteria bacterium ADurb.BinA305]
MNAGIAGAAWVLPLTFALLALAAALILLRLVRGPRAPDRVVAIDALSMIAIATIALLALSTGQPMLLDAAVVLSLVSFLGTTAFILLFRRRGREADPAAGPQGRAPGGGEAAGTEREASGGAVAGLASAVRETRGGAVAEREPCANGEAAR